MKTLTPVQSFTAFAKEYFLEPSVCTLGSCGESFSAGAVFVTPAVKTWTLIVALMNLFILVLFYFYFFYLKNVHSLLTHQHFISDNRFAHSPALIPVGLSLGVNTTEVFFFVFCFFWMIEQTTLFGNCSPFGFLYKDYSSRIVWWVRLLLSTLPHTEYWLRFIRSSFIWIFVIYEHLHSL